MVMKAKLAGVVAAGVMAAGVVSAAPDGGRAPTASDERAAAFDTYLASVRDRNDSISAYLRTMKALAALGYGDRAREDLGRWLHGCKDWEKKSPDNLCSDAQAVFDALPVPAETAASLPSEDAPTKEAAAQKAVDAAVEARLRTPALWRAYEVVDVQPRKRARRDPVRLPFAEDDVVFAAVEGGRAVVVATSRDVDPRGEVSVGGYVIHLSGDGGKSWRGPLHTGFAAGFPFRVRDNGGARVFDGEVLQVPVDVEEIDSATIKFPPVSLGTLRERKNCVVRIPLRALEKDSDKDGLPDLLEERLATDPENADTDGDGTPDAWDTHPLQRAASFAADARFVAAALQAPRSFSPAIVERPGGEMKVLPPRPTAAATDWAWRPTDFFVDGVIPSKDARIVGLSRAAVEAYGKKLGPIYPGRVSVVSDGRRAVVEFSRFWGGFTALVEEREDGSFSVSLLRKWVT